ncbi:SRPBCC family protein [Ramlibacter sp. G-1-2-2]|uniref:SRPBCC family protein n=1 Tax=Ramlibacter agri TaxID=2728837 RepID=A0A848HI78_9BURK|nr:SRPBCC family protein [Ramlibacter agri]NML48223.1 SRPBCC family protein [Ramlibacter agri]
MKVEISRSFALPGSAEAGWAVLQDVEAVAGCMPGAQITQRIHDSHYKGTVAVKLGPASLSFRGEIEVKALDAGARSIRLLGRGTDATGTSGASMELAAHIEAVDGSSSRLVGTSEVSMSGKVATFGARLMGPVADQVLAQFAGNFAAKVQAQAAALPAAAAVAPPAEAKPLNGLALAWAMLREWLHSLFARRA